MGAILTGSALTEPTPMTSTGGPVEDLTPELPELWRQQQLCDVTLVSAEGRSFRAHKIILASASRYFEALFVGGGRHLREGTRTDTDETTVALEVISADSLAAVLRSIYEKRVDVDGDSVQGLLMAANYLDVAPVREACCQFLKAQLDAGSCLHTLELAAHCGCTDLSATTMAYASAHFEEVLMSEQGRGGLAALQAGTLRDLLASDELHVQSEQQVLEALAAWWRHDSEARSAELPQLLATIRLTPADLLRQASAEHADGVLLVGMGSAARQRFTAGLEECARLASGSRAGCPSDAAERVPPPQPRRCMPTGLLAAGGHDMGWRSLRSSEWYDTVKDVWSSAEPLPEAVSFATYTTVQGNLCVCPGSGHTSCTLLWERGRRRWARALHTDTPRLHAAMASLASRAFILGGRTGLANNELRSGECCWLAGAAPGQQLQQQQQLGQWHPLTAWQPCAPMRTARTALGAATLGSVIYAVGGQCGKEVHASGEAFFAERDEWALLGAELLSPRKYHALASLGGRLYAVGGMGAARRRLDTVEAYDPREGRWRAVTCMSVPRSSCGVACLQGRLYAVGGNAGDDAFHTSVEAFSPEAGRWQPCAPISQGRSGLALAAV